MKPSVSGSLQWHMTGFEEVWRTIMYQCSLNILPRNCFRQLWSLALRMRHF